MKLKPLLIAVTLTLVGAAHAADEHGHEHKPLHGGVVAEASHLEFELVGQAGMIGLYVRDHGKPVSLQGASAKLTLLNGSEKTELPLAVAGTRLEAKSDAKLGAGSKAVALVTLAGKKPISVRFALK
jgi:hypothetical protein